MRSGFIENRRSIITIKSVYIASVCLICVFLVGEAMTVLMTGAWLPEAGRTLHVTNACFLFGCCATALHRRIPSLLLLQGWPFLGLFYSNYEGSLRTPHPLEPTMLAYPTLFTICSIVAFLAFKTLKKSPL